MESQNNIKEDKLTPKQKKFVREYFKNSFNATKAAIAAGYSQKTAYRIGFENLRKPHILKFIQEAQKQVDDKDIMTATEILKELSIIGRSDIRDFIDIDPDTGVIKAKGFDQMPDGVSKALESISEDRAIKENNDGSSVTVYDKIKFKMHSKIDALDKLGKFRGLWKDKDPREDDIPDSMHIHFHRDMMINPKTKE